LQKNDVLTLRRVDRLGLHLGQFSVARIL
jgi:hypothetical protein